VLHNSRDEATGHALSRLLNHNLEQARRQLETADEAAFKGLQGEIKTIRKFLEYQTQPAINLPNKD